MLVRRVGGAALLVSSSVSEVGKPRQASRELLQMNVRAVGLLERRPRTLGGKLLIAGTRIPVDVIQRMRKDGASEAAILKLYPDLTRRDLRAALAAPREEGQRRRRAVAG
jgi:uncharacterized protein (DUF433 family)